MNTWQSMMAHWYFVNCKKNDDEEFEEHLAKRLENTYRLCDGDTKNIV